MTSEGLFFVWYVLVSIPIELITLVLTHCLTCQCDISGVQSHHIAPFDRLQGWRSAQGGLGAITFSSRRT